MKDYYKILEVERDASEEEIKKSYYKLAFKFHPDRSDFRQSEELFTEIVTAYKVLSNPKKRMDYDTKLSRVPTGVIKWTATNPGVNNNSQKPPTPKPASKKTKTVPKANPVYFRVIFIIGAILASLLFLDFVLPARTNTENALKIVPGQESGNTDFVETSEGSLLQVSKDHSSRMVKVGEIEIYKTMILGRVYKINFKEWPFTIETEGSNHGILMIVTVLLVFLSIYSFFGNRFTKPNFKVCAVLTSALSLLSILLMV